MDSEYISVIKKIKLPQDIINYVLEFWPEYDPKIHMWCRAILKNRLD